MQFYFFCISHWTGYGCASFILWSLKNYPSSLLFFSSDDEDFEPDEAKEEVSTDKWEGEDEDDNDVKVGKIKFIHSLIFINHRNIQAIPMLRVKQIILNNVQFCHGKL